MAYTFTFKIPHKSAKPSPIAFELTHVIEDNAKLKAELCRYPKFRDGHLVHPRLFEPNVLQPISSLTSKEVKKIHEDLWKFYYNLIGWIAVAKFLGVEIEDPKEIQKLLDKLWDLLDKNPYTRIPCSRSPRNQPRELTSEELSTYQQVLTEYSNQRS